ncbi:MAG: hypothetical protein K8S23_16745 [Candidatus Cloacimonetes bacterium]|nr:hypothetical protein [Candidatus Cloacimonadota bacterium]
MCRIEYNAVLDLSAVIWNQDEFDMNSYQYYKVLLGFSSLLSNLSTENVLMRKELSNQLMYCFPFKEIKNLKKYDNKFWDIGRLIYSFIGKINNESKIYSPNCTPNINSKPAVIKQYYNDIVKLEICYLLSKIHSEKETKSVYFTFEFLWNGNDKLKTETKDKVNTYKTIISDRGSELRDFFAKFKPVFEHHTKHTRIKSGEYESSLSCFDGKDKTIPQKLLENGIKSGKCYYNYDLGNEVYVIFRYHMGNKYHGYDERNPDKIPKQVKKHFNIWKY